MVDPGENISAISWDLCRKTPLGIIKFNNDTSRSGRKYGMVSLSFVLGGLPYQHDFLVVQNLQQDLILGYDFLRSHDADYDPMMLILFISGNQVKLAPW